MTDQDHITTARRAMAGLLIHDGWLRTPEWIEAFRSVARHRFTPEVFRPTVDGRAFEAIDDRDPGWLSLVYGNSVLTTQLDSDSTRWRDSRGKGPTHGTATSSSTQPSLMAGMLEALDVHDGHRVLEMGTGTGYNTALLCHRLGEGLVTSVEYDAHVAAQARRALAQEGYRPNLVIGDGAVGHPDGAPYDRLVATYAVASIPQDWITQTRPGGTIVCSLHHDLDVGLMVALTVGEHDTAHGRLMPDEASFMPSRAQDRAPIDVLLAAASRAPEGEKHASRLPGIIPDPAPGWAALAALLVPGVARVTLERADGPVQWLLHRDGSWAFCDPATGEVEQGGIQRLWTGVEDAYDLWIRFGGPDRTRFGISVSSATEAVWLDRPGEMIRRWPRTPAASRHASES